MDDMLEIPQPISGNNNGVTEEGIPIPITSNNEFEENIEKNENIENQIPKPITGIVQNGFTDEGLPKPITN